MSADNGDCQREIGLVGGAGLAAVGKQVDGHLTEDTVGFAGDEQVGHVHGLRGRVITAEDHGVIGVDAAVIVFHREGHEHTNLLLVADGGDLVEEGNDPADENVFFG